MTHAHGVWNWSNAPQVRASAMENRESLYG
jgi:hypothetical protein